MRSYSSSIPLFLENYPIYFKIHQMFWQTSAQNVTSVRFKKYFQFDFYAGLNFCKAFYLILKISWSRMYHHISNKKWLLKFKFGGLLSVKENYLVLCGFAVNNEAFYLLFLVLKNESKTVHACIINMQI